MAEFIPFRFHVQLSLPDSAGGGLVCNGAFSEVSGLEASMAPKTLKEGGRNWGEVQLAGPTTFATVVLKRGITDAEGLWRLFDRSFRQSYYALRLNCGIQLIDPADPERAVMVWTLDNVLPIKFKGPDLNASANQVAIEELHLNHEGFAVNWNQSVRAVQNG
ncbi:phage tail protein [Methylomonas sp. SURF-2]|uniref:Phage tail protein n=1 Tax=Methylomonas subterranea TaxID=2952225 RepID=A0ABT1TE34_9GAMM|nr:phage tail protein [Methylomonas sp. SURF-2]MCQ8103720.1 phage tail protein [Methylomonas sp. SURF-2]